MFHVYVDPLFGDDLEATARNPVAMPTPNRLRPLDIHQDPGDAADPHPIAGVLQHAPFSFQTLGAAVTYARQFLPGAQIPRAFWTNTIQFDTELAIFTVSRIVVHCLPGLYGPRLSAGATIDPASGIPFNGEQWPVQLPSFLSIQGTSALDTIFDARGQSTYVIGVPAGAGDLPEGTVDAHLDSFIDSVTIRNAAEGSEGQAGAGAGIRVFHVAPLAALVPSSFLSITNCFIVHNAVGIGVDSFVPGRPDHAHHVRIVNNTVAFNRIGLWSGNSQATEPRPAENVLLVLNTIFDSGAVGALSGFEGVSTDERELDYRGSGGPPSQYFFLGLDTNAWEPSRVNLQVGLVNWPATQARILGGTPVVDITLYTQLSPGRVGCLYVADIFDAAWTPGYSPHDLRLAPMVTTNRSVPPNLLNPLVNRGIGPVPGGSPQLLAFPIVMILGQRLDWSPGLRPNAEGGPAQIPTPVHGWDYDGEGFGNLRDQPRVGFPVNPVPELGEMDIGADEMGRYIIAGFFNGTRILSPDPVPGAPLAAPHGRIFFFDLPGPPSPRPVCNIYPGGYAYWFDHVQGTIDAEVNNYTFGTTIGSTTPGQSATRTMLNAFGWKPFMRGLWCDFTPHLVPDLHPFWGGWMADPAAVPPMANDIYATNPWYDDPARAPNPPFVSRPRFDNPALFHNFHVPGYTASTSWPQLSAPMYVRDATLNPPGTYPLGTPWTTGTNGPWTLFPNQILGPYAPCGGTSLITYSVGAWGFGDTPAGCPDVVPGTAGGTLLVAALRFNCELFETNLQTFLGIRTPPPVGGLGEQGRSFQQAPATRVRPTPPPSREELREVVRRVMERN